jgi:hypothetical protein
MIRSIFVLMCCFLGQIQAEVQTSSATSDPPLEKSAYFAYADHEFIFTIELVKPGVPLLNFISMADQDTLLPAKNVRLLLENRKAAGRIFAIEAGAFQMPVNVLTLTMHPRSSFGVRIDGDFGKATEILGVTIRIGNEDFKLVPLASFDFESLALKVNRINLGSPDFSEDWQGLQLKRLGTRSPVRR